MNLENMSFGELREMAKSRGLKGKSKAELLEVLKQNPHGAAKREAEEDVVVNKQRKN